MRADFTPGAGPNGGDELLDPGNLAPIAQVEDPPLDGDGPPWLPPEDWTQAREWDAHPQWPWGLSPAERVYRAGRGWVEGECAYDELQSTKPQSLGYALNDSPVGLAGWMLEKWRSWSDCGGDVVGHFGRDFLLAMLTIYWVTETATSSARLYYDHRRYQTEPETAGH